MAFNEKGEWFLPDPIENYANMVLKSLYEPRSASNLWTDNYRRQLHNEAAEFLMQRDGVKHLDLARQKVEEEIQKKYGSVIQEAHSKVPLASQVVSQLQIYKRVGD